VRGAELAEPRDATREDILAEAGHLQTYGIDGIITCMPARQGLIDCRYASHGTRLNRLYGRELDCDGPVIVHKVCSTFPAFTFKAEPVVPVMDAVRVELVS
jgi:hypothetical protein